MRLTKRAVAALELPDGKTDMIVWDDSLPSFGVRLRPASKSYVVQYRTEARRTRRYKIASTDTLSTEDARNEARAILARVARGGDPSGERQEARHNATLREFWTKEARPHFQRRVRALTLKAYDTTMDKHILPRLGATAVASITRRDIVRLHTNLRSTPYAANRAVATLRTVLSLAVEVGAVEHNVAFGIRKFKEEVRERVLSAEEMAALLKAIEDTRQETGYSPHALAAIRLLFWTGLRKREATGLLWEWVDEERRLIRFPEHATKGGSRTMPLSPQAWQVIAAQNDLGISGPYVFPGMRGGPVDIEQTWRYVRKQAKMPKLRIHDLRHNCGTWAALGNMSGPTIKSLLGHKDMATSAKYIHVGGELDPVRLAAQQVADSMQEAIEGAGKVKKAANE